jgi:DNA-directed RNA polymerase specialized sigma24 family protein
MTAGDPATVIELLRRAQADDEAALGRLLDTVKGPVLRHVQHILGKDDPLAEDVAWDALTAAYPVIDQCHARNDKQVYGWFRAIARNAALQWIRSSGELDAKARALPGEAPPEGCLPCYLRVEMRAALKIARSQLDAPTARLLKLRVSQHLSWTEIGRDLGIPPDAARMRFQRARGALRGTITAIILDRAAKRGEDVQEMEHYLAKMLPRKLRRG